MSLRGTGSCLPTVGLTLAGRQAGRDPVETRLGGVVRRIVGEAGQLVRVGDHVVQLMLSGGVADVLPAGRADAVIEIRPINGRWTGFECQFAARPSSRARDQRQEGSSVDDPL